MVFPRIIALSEVLWSKKENRDWNSFEKRLPIFLERLDNKKINYSKAYSELKAKTTATPKFDGVYWDASTKAISTFSVKNDVNEIVKPENKTDTSYKVKIIKTGKYTMYQTSKNVSTPLTQEFNFNKATGKKITLNNQPNDPYLGDGAFTLVNGIQNTKGMARSTEFVGFNGTDVEATIDFGEDVTISTISIHCLDKNNSWIYLPSSIEVVPIPYIDPAIVTRQAPLESTTKNITDKNNVQVLTLPAPKTCRSIRILIKNFGKIPAGNAGEGKPAWLFVDEIEVN